MPNVRRSVSKRYLIHISSHIFIHQTFAVCLLGYCAKKWEVMGEQNKHSCCFTAPACWVLSAAAHREAVKERDLPLEGLHAMTQLGKAPDSLVAYQFFITQLEFLIF